MTYSGLVAVGRACPRAKTLRAVAALGIEKNILKGIYTVMQRNLQQIWV